MWCCQTVENDESHFEAMELQSNIVGYIRNFVKKYFISVLIWERLHTEKKNTESSPFFQLDGLSV